MNLGFMQWNFLCVAVLCQRSRSLGFWSGLIFFSKILTPRVEVLSL